MMSQGRENKSGKGGKSGKPGKGKGRVLVIDDEEALAQVIEYALSREHEVVIATRADLGLQLLLGDEEFDLIFCDLAMPGMNGMELYEQTVRAKPEITDRIIFMSGGAVTPEARKFVNGLVRDRMVEKPFSLKTIRQLVHSRITKFRASG